MRRSSVLHRTAAVLASVLMFQLSLLGAGTLCRMHAGSENTMAHAEHATHSMPDGAHHGCDETGANKSCDTSSSPGSPAGCAAMSSCGAPVAALALAPDAATSASPITLIVVTLANTPLGPVFAPEIPPPRA